ncbi:N-acetylmuramoyl-L-alanine amidase [Streptomyces sp. MP131-18]|uniref:N-acetylmuramoyl-L-alanine amidase n=1 Tax=Streptomyces sp. MP131-18 TaxID=1857892 RepID=UPI00097CB422|nr:N-acetylmuramoyl-L-alanine amidase [Streptomyces sp. MP131-18]
MEYVSRAGWGARAYRQPSGAIQYSRPRKGVKVHYLGGAYSDRPHSQCSAYVRQIQNQHMNGNGWSDIGYSFVVCTHGTVYEGRGLKRRNSANGNTSLNEQHYAVLGLHGTNSGEPGAKLLDGIRDAIDYCRKNGPCGSEIKGHKDGYATACPGPELYAWVRAGAPRSDKEEPVTEAEMKKLAELTAERVWVKDHLIDVPWGTTQNPHWAAGNIITDTGNVLREVRGRVKQVQAQQETIRELVQALASRDEAIDVDALIQRIEERISALDVRIVAE